MREGDYDINFGLNQNRSSQPYNQDGYEWGIAAKNYGQQNYPSQNYPPRDYNSPQNPQYSDYQQGSQNSASFQPDPRYNHNPQVAPNYQQQYPTSYEQNFPNIYPPSGTSSGYNSPQYAPNPQNSQNMPISQYSPGQLNSPNPYNQPSIQDFEPTQKLPPNFRVNSPTVAYSDTNYGQPQNFTPNYPHNTGNLPPISSEPTSYSTASTPNSTPSYDYGDTIDTVDVSQIRSSVNQMTTEQAPSNDYAPTSQPPEVTPKSDNKSALSRTELRKGYNMRVLKTLIKDLAFVFVAALILSVIVKNFIFSPFQVPSGSMENTLQINDKIVANKTALWGGIHRGDIVVFYDAQGWLGSENDNKTSNQNAAPNPVGDTFMSFMKFVGFVPEDDNSFLVKRVIGVPGDHIVSEGGDSPLKINDVTLDKESYIKPGTHASKIPFDITVPDGCLWVMGDNRDNSADSRYHITGKNSGFVNKSDVVGVVNWIISPFDRFGGIESNITKLQEIPTEN